MITLLLFASLVSASPSLKDYPDFFERQGEYAITMVVGADAPSHDVLAATDITTFIVAETKSNKVYSALGEEITSYDQHMVVIGNPCTNPVSKFLFETDECEVIKKGEALIGVLESKKDYYYLMVAGNTPEATRIAGKVLSQPEKYIFDDGPLCVWGTLSRPQAEPCSTSTYTAKHVTASPQKSTTPSSPSQMTPEEVEIKKQEIQEKTLELGCPGCVDEKGTCFSLGEQHTIKGKQAYCKEDQLWYPVKAEGKSCTDSYQCKTDYCGDGICAKEAKAGFMKTFFTWILDLIFG